MPISPSKKLKWELIEPFGVEIECDLRVTLAPEDAILFKILYLENSLVIIRNQSLSFEDQLRIMSHIDQVRIAQETMYMVSNDPRKGFLGKGELRFHFDLAGTSCPRKAGSLHAIDVEDSLTSTIFTNASLGYNRLSDDIKDRLKGLKAIHVNASANDGSKIAIGDMIDPNSPSAIHPLIIAHPQTGKPVLYISHLDTAEILGIPTLEMISLAEHLFQTLYDPRNIVEHIWKNGDLVIWDNTALQHARGDCSNIGNRTLQRVVISKKLLTEMENDRYDIPVSVPAFREFK